MVEDTVMQQQRVLGYLVHQNAALCEDVQNRLRRNDIRIFQVPEESEGGNMVTFLKVLLHNALTLPLEMDIKNKRAHHSLTSKSQGPTAPVRSIIVRFLDGAIKDAVIQQAWGQGKVLFWEKFFFFDQDYC